MLNENLFPILEYDSNKKAKLEPYNLIKKKEVPKSCVITFFNEVIHQKFEDGKLKQIGTVSIETDKKSGKVQRSQPLFSFCNYRNVVTAKPPLKNTMFL